MSAVVSVSRASAQHTIQGGTVAKHRMPQKRVARKAILASAAAAGVSSALVLGHTTNNDFMVQLTNVVIGSGGLGDSTGVRVPDKLSGTVIPAGFGYVGSFYPAGLDLAASRDAGVPAFHQAIIAANNGQLVIGMGYSEGTLVVEQERRNLQATDPASAPSNTNLGFVQIASPFPPNGGIFGRFPGIGIPLLIDGMGAGEATRYDTTYITNEYDPYGDFPAYFNPLTLLNTALGLKYAHPDEEYDPIVPGTTPAISTTVTNSAGGHDTYILYYNANLPLLGPLRDLSTAIGLTPFTEPVLSAIEPLLRVAVDMGYTDRQNLNPATPTPFSLITPPANIIEALTEVPGALAQGVNNFVNGGQQAISPLSQVSPLSVSAASVTAVGGGDVSASRLAIAAAPAQAPTGTTDAKDAKDAKDDPTSSTTPAAGSSDPTTKPKPTAAPKPTGDGLHPEVTSDGNKVTPGGSTETTAGSGKTPETKTSDSKTPDDKTGTKASDTTTTTSTTAGSTTGKSTPGTSTAGGGSSAGSSGAEGGHSAAA
jgi:hypothetical protein